MSRVLYARTSFNRLPEYQVTTRIVEREDGTLVVRKSAANPRAIAFVRSLVNKCHSISVYALPFSVVPATRFWNEVELPFMKGETLYERWTKALQNGVRSKLLDLCAEFRELLRTLPVVDAPTSDQFISMFGVDVAKSEPHVEPGLIDLRFDNLIVDPQGKMHLVDYEWTSSFAIPVSFILFRAISGWFSSLASYAPWRIITLGELFDCAGVPRTSILRLDAMEKYFQGSIHGQNIAGPTVDSLMRGDLLHGLTQLEQFTAQQTVQNLKERIAFIEQNAAEKQQLIDQLQRLCDERGRVIENLERAMHSINAIQHPQTQHQERPSK